MIPAPPQVRFTFTGDFGGSPVVSADGRRLVFVASHAILVVGTPLCSIVGVNEAMTLTNDALAAEARRELLVPMYLYLLLWFFLYCYPIARATLALEKRFAVR